MIKNKKQMFIVIGVFCLILLLGTTTYAFFNYTRTGGANTFKTGRIYYNSEQNGNLTLTNMFPMKSNDAGIAQLDSVTINLKGDTTYVDVEEFEVTITDVNNTVNGKKIPLNYIATYTPAENKTIGTSSNDYWNARENKNANIYLLNASGEVKNGKQVLVGYIDNVGSGIEGTLTIKAYIDADRIAISDTYDGSEDDNHGTTENWVDGRTVFTTQEWNSFQNSGTPVSFKVRVESNEGIWVDKEATPDQCFNVAQLYTRNPNLNVNTCVSLLTSWGWNEYLRQGETLEDYCSGTGTYIGHEFDNLYGTSLGEFISNDLVIATNNVVILDYNSACGSDVVIPKKMKSINKYTVNPNMNTNTCVSVLTDLEWDENLDQGETLEDFCDGTGTIYDATFQEAIDEFYFKFEELSVLEENNIIIYQEISGNMTPTYIGLDSFYDKGLTSIEIPNSVTDIDSLALMDNQFTKVSIDMADIPSNFATNYLGTQSLNNLVIGKNVETVGTNALPKTITTLYIDMENIPNSFHAGGNTSDNRRTVSNLTIGSNVRTIGTNAFYNNNISSLTILDGVTTIGDNAFSGISSLTNVTIPDSVVSQPWIDDDTYTTCKYFNNYENISLSWNNQTITCNNRPNV